MERVRYIIIILLGILFLVGGISSAAELELGAYITGRTELSSPASDDLLLIYDISGTSVKKIQVGTLYGGSGLFEPVITAGTSLQYWRGDKNWTTLNTSVVPESINLYYTDARSRAALSSTATGFTYTSATGVFSLTALYEIPLATDTAKGVSAYGWGNHVSGGYFIKASDTLDNITIGSTNVHLTTTLKSNYDTAYTDRLKWDGGATGLVAATGRTSLELGTGDSPTFTGLTLSGLTASKPVFSSGVKALSSTTPISIPAGGGYLKVDDAENWTIEAGTAGNTTLNYQVSAGGDDTYIDYVTFNGTGGIISTGNSGHVDNVRNSSIRFLGVSIPQGSLVLHAYLKLTAYESNSETVASKIYANDENNAVAPTSYAEFAALGLTATSISWVSSVWTQNVEYTSPDIATVIQEIIDRSGWVSGNALQILWKDNGSDVNVNPPYHIKSAHSYNGSPSYAPKLSVTFQVSGTHGLLSSTHTDSTTASPIRGDIIIAQGASTKWTRKPIGSAGYILTSDGIDAVWATPNHTLFSSTHDAIPIGSVAQGDIIFRGASAWNNRVKGAQYTILTMNATEPVWTATPRLTQLSINSGLMINANCTASVTPWGCCTGSGTGTCPTVNLTLAETQISSLWTANQDFLINAIIPSSYPESGSPYGGDWEYKAANLIKTQQATNWTVQTGIGKVQYGVAIITQDNDETAYTSYPSEGANFAAATTALQVTALGKGTAYINYKDITGIGIEAIGRTGGIHPGSNTRNVAAIVAVSSQSGTGGTTGFEFYVKNPSGGASTANSLNGGAIYLYPEKGDANYGSGLGVHNFGSYKIPNGYYLGSSGGGSFTYGLDMSTATTVTATINLAANQNICWAGKCLHSDGTDLYWGGVKITVP